MWRVLPALTLVSRSVFEMMFARPCLKNPTNGVFDSLQSFHAFLTRWMRNLPQWGGTGTVS